MDTPPSIYHDGDASANLDILLSRPDISAVIIALPITVQPTFILKALAAGKHALSEKPVAPDVKRGLEVIDTYRQLYKSKGLIWRVAENSEAEPGYRAVAAAIQSGKIGKVILFKTLVTNYIDKNNIWYKTPWRTVPDVRYYFFPPKPPSPIDRFAPLSNQTRYPVPRWVFGKSLFIFLPRQLISPRWKSGIDKWLLHPRSWMVVWYVKDNS